MKKGDFLILVLVIFFGVGGILFFQNRSAGKTLVVEAQGQELTRISMAQDVAETAIIGGLGYNTYTIDRGKARMVAADCPDGLCLKRGEINKEGESIVCLPNQVVLYLIGGESSEVDAITE